MVTRADPAANGTEEDEDTGDSIESLEAVGDVDALLAAAKAYRSGAGVPRDLVACFRAYDAASRLGSAEASYLSALFFLRGGVVPEDPKEALARLRTAADGGSVPAKVYLANMYEAGANVRADRDKADAWIRNIARAAGIDAAAGSAEYARAMADLGVARFALELAEKAATPAEAEALRKKATAFGWRAPRASAPPEISTASSIPTPAPAPAAGQKIEAKPDPSKSAQARRAALDAELADDHAIDSQHHEDVAHERRSRGALVPQREVHGIQWRFGLLRFVYALMFAGAAIAAAHLLTQGAALLVARGQPVPLVGPHIERITPIVLAAVTGIPALLLYGFTQVARAAIVALVAGISGAVIWGHPQTTLLTTSTEQGIAFALGGFLAGLLVFGLVSGDRRARKRARPGPFRTT